MNIYEDAMNKLAKWRNLLTGWQLGSRAKGDPEGDAVSDHREATLMLRAEVTAIGRILIEQEIVSLDDYWRIMAEEAEHLCVAYEKKFPGFQATIAGIMVMDPGATSKTTRGWKR